MDPLAKISNRARTKGGHSECHLLKVAEAQVNKRVAASPIISKPPDLTVPTFAVNELEIGKVLGRGAFSVVCDITNIRISQRGAQEGLLVEHADDDQFDFLFQNRKFMVKNCLRAGKDCRYAIKFLQDSVRQDPSLYVRSLVDIVVETRFLAVVRHPNIIKMRGISCASPFEPGPSFFVVMDKLYEMLTTRLNTSWKKKAHNKLTKLLDLSGKKAREFWVERLVVLSDISSAIAYLHRLNIVYRDLKMDNIGFDVRGDPKMFDFGLAREMQPSLRYKDGTYKMTGDVGSLRYMAPEVALEKPYNETCDVYSFSILMWQILKVEMPYELYDRPDSFQSKVVKKGVRPRPDASWPEELVRYMKNGWDADWKQRSSMADMSKMLDQMIYAATGEDRLDAGNHSRHSMANFKTSLAGENSNSGRAMTVATNATSETCSSDHPVIAVAVQTA